MPKRPNILFIETDSQDGRLMSCMGHPALRGVTPNFDRLAARGVLFRQTYSNNPICCPSRASMFSGQFTHHCEGWNNYKGLEPGTPTFLTRLDEAGYTTQTVGKTDYVSGKHTIRARVSPWTRSAKIHRPQYNMHPPKVEDDTETRRYHEGDWEKVDRAVEFMQQHRDDDNPWLLYVGFGMPHPAFWTNRYWLEKIDPMLVTVPPKEGEKHPVMQYSVDVKNWTHPMDDESVRLVRRIYYAMIAEVDAMLGDLLSTLEEQGLEDNTYVIFTSDHGEMNMEHDQFYKMNHYEAAVRVPLMVAGPDIVGGQVTDHLTSLVDLYPTVMDMVGADQPDGLDGHSLLPEMTGGGCDRPDWVLSEFHGTTLCTGSFMYRQGPWKYIALPGYKPMLFNLDDDPDEMENLVDSQPEKAAEMDHALREVVDYEAVDSSVKDYDRRAFAQWRREHLAEGDYRELMTKIFSGWDRPETLEMTPWTDEDEATIVDWLGEYAAADDTSSS